MKVKLVMALTLDGKIARSIHDPVNWTGKADKKKFVRITKEAGVMVMGSRTFDAIGRVLPGRKSIVMTRNKSRKSSDSNLVYTDKDPKKILETLEQEGFKEVALIGGGIINSMFANLNLIDEIYVTLVPRIFGAGLSLFNEMLDTHLSLMHVEQLEDNSLLLSYQVNRS